MMPGPRSGPRPARKARGPGPRLTPLLTGAMAKLYLLIYILPFTFDYYSQAMLRELRNDELLWPKKNKKKKLN